jgi:hypothetical protein
VLLEVHDCALRAYTFRKQGKDEVKLTLKPTAAQVNPVFVINGWNTPRVAVRVNGAELSQAGFQFQVAGHDLIVWV